MNSRRSTRGGSVGLKHMLAVCATLCALTYRGAAASALADDLTPGGLSSQTDLNLTYSGFGTSAWPMDSARASFQALQFYNAAAVHADNDNKLALAATAQSSATPVSNPTAVPAADSTASAVSKKRGKRKAHNNQTEGAVAGTAGAASTTAHTSYRQLVKADWLNRKNAKNRAQRADRASQEHRDGLFGIDVEGINAFRVDTVAGTITRAGLVQADANHSVSLSTDSVPAAVIALDSVVALEAASLAQTVPNLAPLNQGVSNTSSAGVDKALQVAGELISHPLEPATPAERVIEDVLAYDEVGQIPAANPAAVPVQPIETLPLTTPTPSPAANIIEGIAAQPLVDKANTQHRAVSSAFKPIDPPRRYKKRYNFAASSDEFSYEAEDITIRRTRLAQGQEHQQGNTQQSAPAGPSWRRMAGIGAGVAALAATATIPKVRDGVAAAVNGVKRRLGIASALPAEFKIDTIDMTWLAAVLTTQLGYSNLVIREKAAGTKVVSFDASGKAHQVYISEYATQVGKNSIELTNSSLSSQVSDAEIAAVLLIAAAASKASSDGSVNFKVSCDQSGSAAEKMQQEIFIRACHIAAKTGITLELTEPRQRAWYNAAIKAQPDLQTKLNVSGSVAPAAPSMLHKCTTALSGLGKGVLTTAGSLVSEGP